MQKRSFQSANRIRKLNRYLITFLLILFIGGLNYLALNYYNRKDLTEDRLFTLSPETKAYLEGISSDVDIVVTVPEGSPREDEQVLYDYVSRLLSEFVYASTREGENYISVEYVDIYKNLDVADYLAREYGLQEANALLIKSNDSFRILRPDDLLEFEDQVPVAFKGEASLASAILEVANKSAPKIYFIFGHGESSVMDTSPNKGLSLLTNELKLRNYQIETLDLNLTSKVPDDASLIMIAAPEGSVLPSEVDKLREFLNHRAGKLLVLITPGRQHGLTSLFSEWGIGAPDQIVLESDEAYQEASGSLIIRNFAEHPIVSSHIANNIFVSAGISRPIFPISRRSDDRLYVSPLFASSDDSWAESSYRDNTSPSFTRGTDYPGPVPIAVAAEKRASSQLGISVPGGKMVVFGSSDLFSNRRMATIGNFRLALNTINWLAERETLLSVPPRPIEKYQLAISAEQLFTMGYTFLIVPGLLLFIGIVVYTVRRL